MSFGPAVLNGRLRYLSVSQLDKFDEHVEGGCERRWWFRYVQRKKEPEKAPQKLGVQVHAQIEHYLRTGQDTLGPLARAGLRFIPKPGKDLLVEYAFGRLYEHAPGGYHGPIVSLLSAGGIPFIGKVDLLHMRGEWIDDEGEIHYEPNVPCVVDWKTSKQLLNVTDENGTIIKKGWAKTAEALANGWQGRGYARLALEIWPEAPAIRVGHGYFQTQGTRESIKRSTLVSSSDVQTKWAEADVLVSKIIETAKLEDLTKVKPNYAACRSYGGCPFLKDCPRDTKLVMAAMLKPRR